jgi:hypothetical protein
MMKAYHSIGEIGPGEIYIESTINGILKQYIVYLERLNQSSGNGDGVEGKISMRFWGGKMVLHNMGLLYQYGKSTSKIINVLSLNDYNDEVGEG